MGYGKEVMRELREPAAALKELIPEVYEGFSQVSTPALAEGEVSKLNKELIALAIAVSKQCDGCISAHTHAAARAGATRQQVAETMGVVILMNGGPGTVYGARALAAFDEFAKKPSE